MGSEGEIGMRFVVLGTKYAPPLIASVHPTLAGMRFKHAEAQTAHSCRGHSPPEVDLAQSATGPSTSGILARSAGIVGSTSESNCMPIPDTIETSCI